MAKAYYSSILSRSVDDVWALVRDFNNYPKYIAADNVTAQGRLAGALGEGLADGLDIGGF